ncbi:MAG: SRPBCC domain-containing protein [Nitrososphaerota archaeon]|jgi:uncharacterized protein YndB with AHSA1/START domain|nr:SRPBCC domain-containing protein [Nitrososphaerota archaeon]
MEDEGKTVVISRVFDAPREVVFRMWTDPKKARTWFGLPADAKCEVLEIDPRSGGKIHLESRNPDGSLYPAFGVFDEVIPPRLITFTSESPLASFKKTTLPDGSPAWKCFNKAVFEEEGSGKTRLTVTVRVIMSAVDPIEDMAAGFEGGWGESLDLLAANLERF